MKAKRTTWSKFALACLALILLQPGGAIRSQTSAGGPKRPNILFIILDDVGIDQLTAFNPAAGTGAITPNLNAMAAAGVKFTNFYTMPECSPSRAAFFTGRYPLRNGVNAAILAQDLPAAQVSPYEVTTPKVLATAGYASAMIGKYHLGGPENNPDGSNAPLVLGWNYFNGNLRGGPPPIDKTLGGQYTKDTTKYSSGFPTGTTKGAAWFLDRGSSQPRCDDNQGAGYTGQNAVERGGIPALDAQGEFAATCRAATGTPPNFAAFNGYYVWPQVIVDSNGAQTFPSRQYMTTAQTDAAIAWIQSRRQAGTEVHRSPQPGRGVARSWMATVSYNAIHTPYQQPPTSLYPPGFTWPSAIPEDANNSAAQRVMSDLMLGALDREIGRLLVGAGVARQDPQGRLVYDPSATDTMVVIAGDNGTFLASVKAPYDPIRAKGTPYETGVLAPLIVAGPLVASPGRTVDALVNAVDLFQLFGEVAGVDVHKVVPAAHVLDSTSMLPYLTTPNRPALRETSFTQLGAGLKPPSVKIWPCVIAVGPISIATDILFTSESICSDNGGKWFGPTTAQPTPQYPTSCSILQAGLYPNLMILPNQVWAMRNRRYKLVKVERPPCLTSLGEYEFYDLAANPPSNPAGLDLSSTNLLKNGQPTNLTSDQLSNYMDLMSRMQTLLQSEEACYGDGNLTKTADLNDLRGLVDLYGKPSVFDFNADGVTDDKDIPWVTKNLENNCLKNGAGVKGQ